MGKSETVKMGYFNADANGDSYSPWGEILIERNMVFPDVLLIDAGSYSHANHGTLSRSWLDHCSFSSTIDDAMQSTSFDSTCLGLENSPLHIDIAVSDYPMNICV